MQHDIWKDMFVITLPIAEKILRPVLVKPGAEDKRHQELLEHLEQLRKEISAQPATANNSLTIAGCPRFVAG